MSHGRTVGLVCTHVLGALLAVCIVIASGPAPGQSLAAFLPSLPQVLPSTLMLISALATGWLLAAKQPRNAVGWALMTFVLLLVLEVPALLLGAAVQRTAPGVTAWLFWYAGDSDDSWAWLPPIWMLLIWLPLHFPDGRLPSPRWRWFSRFTVVVLAGAVLVFSTSLRAVRGVPNPVGIDAVRALIGPLLVLLAVLAVICFAGTVVSLVARYRGGSGLLRAQLRWVLWGVAIAALTLSLSWTPLGTDAYDDWSFASFSLIPVSIAIAVLRYRLYEIDRIISRTAAYAIVTLIVVGTYAVVVLSASALIPGLPAVGVALATLAAAAVFLPVLRRVRRGIDRVFNRAQYDAERVVVAFGEQLRTGADPHTAADRLLVAVDASLAPSAVGIWLRR